MSSYQTLGPFLDVNLVTLWGMEGQKDRTNKCRG